MSAPFWARPAGELLQDLGADERGLSSEEAQRRLARRGPGLERRGRGVWRILAAQVLNPMVLLLIAAAAVSILLGSHGDGLTILAIVLLSAGLGFFQEHAAEQALARLQALVSTRATVRRDGRACPVALDEVVPGDVVTLSAGGTVPGDARVLWSNGLTLDESALTGESFPAAKAADPVPADAPPAARASALFLGTHVVSGTGEAVVVAVGRDTELGAISTRLSRGKPPTAFDLGLQRFGALLARTSVLLVLCIFAVNVLTERPALESLLFSVALAVGLVPELLPAIVTVTLSRGARRMAEAEVLVKRLSAIEDLGAATVICSDKTGTLTEGRVRLHAALGLDGEESARALTLGGLNATFESGYASPIDAALRERWAGDRVGWTCVGEIPYDFARRRLSVLLEREGRRTLVTKGQLSSVLSVCAWAERPDGSRVPLDEERARIQALHDRLAEEGLRSLGVALREGGPETEARLEEERAMVFAGLLVFTDPPRADAGEAIDALLRLGLDLRVITGDDARVAAHLWRGLRGTEPRVLTGGAMRALTPDALQRRVADAQVFAEVDPAQKERVVTALRRAGHTVAFLGDGINDAPALEAADVGISVDSAADVAREAADIVLRRADLGVLARGVAEGRRTMANTLKYVYYTTSANFGNMVSMAVASVFIPFLPLLPKQILLNNFLSDLPALAIAGDAVDQEQIIRPRRWSTPEICSFMFVFGGISSIFDLLTFAVLLTLADGTPEHFQSGWFVESLLTELLVLFVMRTHLPMLRSRPAPAVLWITLGVALLALVLPWLPLGALFGLDPLPPGLLLAVVAITITYVLVTEHAKRRFFARRAETGKALGA